MPNVKARVAVDEDIDDLDGDLDNVHDEDDDETPAPKVATPAPKVGGTAPVARKAPVAVPARPVVVAPAPGDEDVSDVDFDREAKKRRDAQKVNDFLERKRSEETTSVDEITELMMEGNTDKIMHELVKYCGDNSGIKTAKQLLREARDRAKARITRIAGVVAVMVDELKQEEDDKGGYGD